MTTKDRLKEFLSFKKIGRNKFEERAKIAIGYMSSKSISISSDVIEKTAVLFPDLNIEWLVTGKGAMTRNAEREQKTIEISESAINESLGYNVLFPHKEQPIELQSQSLWDSH